MIRHNLIPLSNRSIFDEMDRMFVNSFKQDTNYPPYNVFTKEDDDEHTYIEIAVSGFSKDDLKVYFDDEGYLVIDGEKDTKDKNNYIHRGLSKKNFMRRFQVAKNFEVSEITVKDGLMIIDLKKSQPDKKLLEIK